MDFKLVGQRFYKLREKNGISKSNIASYLDVDQSYISKCENGERQFSVDILEKAADLFYCNISYFIDRDYEEIPTKFKANKINNGDLDMIAAINKIALNIKFMENLLEKGQS